MQYGHGHGALTWTCSTALVMQHGFGQWTYMDARIVSDPRKGVCADPVNGGAILGKGGPNPDSGDRERQLAPDKGREKT
jgi:hypothetical protein